MAVTAVIPLKSLGSAKGRLAHALEPGQRRAFVAWMARRVIAACAACDGIAEILVVAGDEEAADVARARGVTTVVVEQPGLDAAMTAADRLTADREATLVVAADLPHVTPQELQAVIAAGETAAVVVAPTLDGGTGALLRRPPAVMTTAYGVGSAQRHQARAVAAGASVHVVRRPGLAADVDTPAQLHAALALVGQRDVPCDQ